MTCRGWSLSSCCQDNCPYVIHRAETLFSRLRNALLTHDFRVSAASFLLPHPSIGTPITGRAFESTSGRPETFYEVDDIMALVSKPIGKDKEFACRTCGKSYSQKGNLQRHIKLECGKTPQFQCSVCCKTFTRKDNMKIHMKMLHERGVDKSF